MKQVKCSAILYSLPKQLNLFPRSSQLTVQFSGNYTPINVNPVGGGGVRARGGDLMPEPIPLSGF